MTIKTKVPVTYNSGVTGTSEGIVSGIINDASWINDFNCIGVNYQYFDENGRAFHIDSFTINEDQIDALYEAIKESIPSTGTYRDIERFKFYLGFVFQMAQTFELNIDQIEIVT
jgi:hypothetical protein